MNFIDCFMYFDEDTILDIRLNILDKYVSFFIICEANFNHNGTERELRFNINNFPKFRDKIIYIPLEKQPENLRSISKEDSLIVKNSKILDNALLRENFQRNFLQNKIKDFHEDDYTIDCSSTRYHLVYVLSICLIVLIYPFFSLSCFVNQYWTCNVFLQHFLQMCDG